MLKNIRSQIGIRASLRTGIIWGALLVLISGVILQTVSSQQPPITQSAPRKLGHLKPPSVKFTQGPVIPGLRQQAIPQGIAYVSDNQRIIISHYFENAPSCLTVLNHSTGKMISNITLKEAPGKLHHGHVGGIAVLKDSLFVASDGYLLQYQLAPILSMHPPNNLSPLSIRKSETAVSFCTATKKMLFVGEFAYGKKYPTKTSHHIKDRKGVQKKAWVCGYDANDLQGAPKCVLSIRQRVQGMCLTDDRIFLSISYGRRNRSKIVVYRNPIGNAAHANTKIQNGNSVPLWFLDGENYIGEIDFPPMSEGITMIGDQLAVLSESGASKYQFGGKGPLDIILLLDVSKMK